MLEDPKMVEARINYLLDNRKYATATSIIIAQALITHAGEVKRSISRITRKYFEARELEANLIGK